MAKIEVPLRCSHCGHEMKLTKGDEEVSCERCGFKMAIHYAADDAEVRKAKLKDRAFILENDFSRAHWIITDMQYGYVSDKNRAVKQLTQIKNDVEEALILLKN